MIAISVSPMLREMLAVGRARPRLIESFLNPMSRPPPTKHALITGGSSGIGLALALRLARAGHRVSLVARDPARLAAAAAAVRAAAPDSAPFPAPADVADEKGLASALSAAVAAHGPIDLLITSAGVAEPGRFGELAPEVFRRAMEVNYFGSLHAVRHALPAMRARRSGEILLVGSGAGLFGFFGYTAYGASKFALRGLAESLRAELDGSGVHLSIVYPPDTDTPQLAAENLLKPPETAAVTAGGGLWTADAVAAASLRGLARRRFAIAPGAPLAALLWLHSLLAPVLHRVFARAARRARLPA
jgi:3-dehydrosphinganine reductase